MDVIDKLSLTIALFAVAVSLYQLMIQRNFNKKSVMPLPEIRAIDLDENMSVAIRNNGLGPMICQRMEVTDRLGHSKAHVVDWLPKGIKWDFFIRKENYAISPNVEVELLTYKGKSCDDNYEENRKICRSILKDLIITLYYTDIYGKKFVYTKDLAWFADESKELS
ncbi:hypothetical protein GC194_05905 [bacterium]|nr:hypothetical protein [bacterium]